ncbi:PREDICTED: ankyrin-1-like [Fragaria vesca subsp. vesca]|uniref:ankyrin-1-like n=1 Tax=Fragaria vesca subsp. vesca TaxID=101020 RepID=UPI0002C34B12|nr:PREDICTED: ankyrin-1-like [Fragaria vesca subsp. vesca]
MNKFDRNICHAGFDENNSDHLERYKSFVRYVVSGDWDKAKECLGEVDVRSVVVRAVDGLEGAITLHVAAWEGHAHMVKDLVHLMTQEDLKTKTDSGHHTALHMAAQKGHVHVVKELPVLLMGEVQDMDGDTALHLAVQDGKVDVVKELVLLMRQEDLKIKNDAGYTALHLAVNKGDMPMVKEFVTKEKVTAVDPTDDYGYTALHVAAREGHLDVIRGLVSLLKTRQEDHLELKTAEDFTTFGSAISLGVSEEILMEKAKYMVEQYENTLGSILEIQNANGSTALHSAVLTGKVDIVKELVPFMRKEGLEIQDADGCTPLNCALLYGNVDIAKE